MPVLNFLNMLRSRTSSKASRHHGDGEDQDKQKARFPPLANSKPSSNKPSCPTISIFWIAVMIVMVLASLLVYHQQEGYTANRLSSLSTATNTKKKSSHVDKKNQRKHKDTEKRQKEKEKEKHTTADTHTIMMPDTNGAMISIPEHDSLEWYHKGIRPFVDWTMYRVPFNEETYTERFNENYVCPMDEPTERAPLPDRLLPKLWFRTELQTNLNILVMGDSVAVQLAELLQEGMGVIPDERVQLRLLEDQNDHESLFWGVGSHGGGVGGWRLLHFWMRHALNEPLPEVAGGGWVMEDVESILKTAHNQAMFSPNANLARRQVDVVIFRISQPWMSWESMEPRRLMETVLLAHRLLGTTTVIFLTIPFSNNVVDHEDVAELLDKNAMIHHFVQNYPSRPHALPQVQVMVLDFGFFHDELVRENAVDLGFPGVTPGNQADYSFVSSTLTPMASYYVHHIAHVCGGEWVPPLASDCIRNNQITFDGQHVCLKTFGGRFVAAVGCLLECAYPTAESQGELRQCERQCNMRYMSLNAIPASEFENSPGIMDD